MLKRNFDNVSWEWNESKNPYYVFQFPNGLGVMVYKESVQTFDGMMCIAISEYKNGLGVRFNPVVLPEGVYTRAEGLDEDGVKRFCDVIRAL